MGNRGSRSSVPAKIVLELSGETANPPPVAHEPPPADVDLGQALATLGVDATGVDASAARRCWELVAHEDFWRSYYALHPNKRRVNVWMFVHRQFRALGVALVKDAERLATSLDSGVDREFVAAATIRVEGSLRRILKKVNRHSEFEDDQLFRFFREHFPDIRDDVRDFEADHSEKQLEDKALASFKALREGIGRGQQHGSAGSAARIPPLAADAVTSVKAYVSGLERHLEREERMLVGRWLNLSPALYKTYRGYLSGKYRLVY